MGRMNAAAITSARQSKGEETRSQILSAAVEQASTAGFESLTIGTLAEKTGMSKSGLFAHFGSKLDLQVAALDECARQFTEAVFMPALKVPRGVKRLKALFENWITWPQRRPCSSRWRRASSPPQPTRARSRSNSSPSFSSSIAANPSWAPMPH